MFGRIIESLNSSHIVAEYEIRQLVEEHSASFLKVKATLVDGSHLYTLLRSFGSLMEANIPIIGRVLMDNF